LPWHKSNPGGQLAAIFEDLGIRRAVNTGALLDKIDKRVAGFLKKYTASKKKKK